MKDFIKTVLASALGFILGSTLLFGFFIFAIIVASAVIMATHGSRDLPASLEERSVIFLNIEGALQERRTATDVIGELIYEEQSKDVGLFELSEALRSAAADERIKGLYLRLRWVDSGWSRLESLRGMLQKFKASGKFIYAYSEAYDEKLYYLASIADEILMYPKGEFEWNGIYMQPLFFKKTLGKLEIEPTLIRAGKFKSAGEMVTQEKMSDENRLQVSELTSALWTTVRDEIAAARKTVTAEQLDEWARTIAVTNAREAYNLKLVNQLMPVEEVENKLRKKTGLKKDEDVRFIAWNSYRDLNPPNSFLGSKNKVAVILAEGEIQIGSGSNSDMIYSDELAGLIRDIGKEDDIKAVVLRVNSPGGSALASDVIWRSLEYLKKKKIIVTSFSDVAASGGYYIAAGTHYIFAEPTTVTGSIGVFGLMFNTSKFLDNKLGVTLDQVKTHPSADMMSATRDLTPFEKQRVQEDVDSIYKTFLNVVHQGRKKIGAEENVREIAEGRVWAGSKAMEIGLVDGMGSLDDAIAKAVALAKLKDYEVVIYPDEEKFLDRILRSFEGAFAFALPTWLQRVMIPDRRQQVVYARLPYIVEF